ncbi:MAG: hypothetical protein HY308_09405 [Gammaproteobacteria bacterium]|nr:hypothetical protein [Gammaproteobacteria bacterium]
MQKELLIVIAILFTIPATANQDAWAPKALFQLESANLEQTMLWISGVSYAFSEYSDQLAKSGKPRLFCRTGRNVPSSLLFEILNKKHPKQRITSEQAIGSLTQELRERFPCS